MKKYMVISMSLMSICLVLNKLYEWFTDIGEKYYTLGINKWWIETLSQLTGGVRFSVFEVLIYIGIVMLIVIGVRDSICFLRTDDKWVILGQIGMRWLFFAVTLYTIFSLFWGLNYNRPALGVSEGLEVKTRSVTELTIMYEQLLIKADQVRAHLPQTSEGSIEVVGGWESVFERANLGYEVIGGMFPRTQGVYGRVKPVLFSEGMNYTGITGIYSPFTAEANVNIEMFPMMMPVTVLHEMAHQRGYTGEDECNFLGYVAAISHPDYDFQYSGYMLGIIHLGNVLKDVSPEQFEVAQQHMSAGIKQDLEDYNTFLEGYEGVVGQLAAEINDVYLKANGVGDGIQSYGRMVDLLLAYEEKYGIR
ncbi:MAG: DUF3810 domain-containing protein [Cellulosilyticaceae bacterium]